MVFRLLLNKDTSDNRGCLAWNTRCYDIAKMLRLNQHTGKLQKTNRFTLPVVSCLIRWDLRTVLDLSLVHIDTFETLNCTCLIQWDLALFDTCVWTVFELTASRSTRHKSSEATCTSVHHALELQPQLLIWVVIVRVEVLVFVVVYLLGVIVSVLGVLVLVLIVILLVVVLVGVVVLVVPPAVRGYRDDQPPPAAFYEMWRVTYHHTGMMHTYRCTWHRHNTS